MIIRKTLIPFLMSLFILGHALTSHADCNTDWFNSNPLQGNLTSQQLTDFNIIMSFIEQAVPEILFPATATVAAGPIAYRFYAGTGTLIGAVQSNQFKLIIFGPLSNNCIMDIGTVADWIAMVPISGQITGIIDESAYNSAQSTTVVSINRMCKNLNDFLALQSQIATTPQGGVAMMIMAMAIYQQDPVVGRQCLSAASTGSLVSPSTAEGSYNGYIITNISTMKNNLQSYPLLPFIYYKGASPSNGYTPTAPPYVLEMYTNAYCYSSGGDGLVEIKLFVKTEGADSARPATVKKVGGIYKITSFSSLYLGFKAAQ